MSRRSERRAGLPQLFYSLLAGILFLQRSDTNVYNDYLDHLVLFPEKKNKSAGDRTVLTLPQMEKSSE